MTCPSCKGTSIRKLRKEKGINIFRCMRCELGFLDKKGLETQSKMRKRLSQLYRFADYRHNEEKLRKRFVKLSESIEKLKPKGKVLEVGAGYGLLASLLQQRNYNVSIIEPHAQLQYINKLKCKVYKTTFERFPADKNRYDMILMMDVLEHFSNPLQSLHKAHTLLRKDGLLVIQTPNYKSLMATLCKNWSWWMVEDHKFFFTLRSLRAMLQKTGFEEKCYITYEDWIDLKKNLDGNFVSLKNPLSRKLIKSLFYLIFGPFYFFFRKTIGQRYYGGLIFAIFGPAKSQDG